MLYNILEVFAAPLRRVGGAGFYRAIPWWWRLISLAWHLLVLGLIVLAVVLLVRAFSRSNAGARFFNPPYPPAYPPPGPAPAPPADPATTLTQAKSLLDQELISQAEYDSIRQTVLARMGQGQSPA